MRVGTKYDKGFYNICDDDGDNHKMPSGIKPFATLDDWQNIYDMCEVRVFEPTEPVPDAPEGYVGWLLVKLNTFLILTMPNTVEDDTAANEIRRETYTNVIEFIKATQEPV